MLDKLKDTKFMLETVTKPVLSGTIAGLLTRFVTYGVNAQGNPISVEFTPKVAGVIEGQGMIGSLYKLASLRNIFPFNRMIGQRYSLAMVTGVVVALASLGADIASGFVYTFITKDQMYDALGSALFQTSAVAGGTLAGHYIVNEQAVDARGLYNIIALAGLSEYLANTIYVNIVAPKIRGEQPMQNLRFGF